MIMNRMNRGHTKSTLKSEGKYQSINIYIKNKNAGKNGLN